VPQSCASHPPSLPRRDRCWWARAGRRYRCPSQAQHASRFQSRYLLQRGRERRQDIRHLICADEARDECPCLQWIVFSYNVGSVRGLCAGSGRHDQNDVPTRQKMCLAHPASLALGAKPRGNLPYHRAIPSAVVGLQSETLPADIVVSASIPQGISDGDPGYRCVPPDPAVGGRQQLQPGPPLRHGTGGDARPGRCFPSPGATPLHGRVIGGCPAVTLAAARMWI